MALAGCCSSDPAGLDEKDPAVVRETLACLAEDVEEDPSLKSRVEKRALALLLPASALPEGEQPDPVASYSPVRATAVRVLGRLKTEQARETLAERLSGGNPDPHAAVRVACVDALAMLGSNEETLNALRLALRSDPDAGVRLAAARELGVFKDASPATTEALLLGLDDVSFDVRLLARVSLRSIHDTDQGLSRRSWEDWYDEHRTGGLLPDAEGEVGRRTEEPETDETPEDEEPMLPPEEEFPDRDMEGLDEDEGEEEEPILPPEEEFPDEDLGPLDGEEKDPPAEEPQPPGDAGE